MVPHRGANNVLLSKITENRHRTLKNDEKIGSILGSTLGALLGALGPLLGGSGASLGRLLGSLEGSWVVFGEPLGLSGPSLGALGAVLGRSGVALGTLLAPCWSILGVPDWISGPPGSLGGPPDPFLVVFLMNSLPKKCHIFA